MDENIMRQLSFDKLQQSMTHIQMVFSEEKNTLSQLAELTDRIADTYHQKPTVSKISEDTSKDEFEKDVART